jgi:CheY-like chemotaxis protein
MSHLILVVEDEQSLNTILRTALEDEGYQVCATSDGPEALHVLHESAPALVLLDYGLPTLDGEQIIVAMQASDALRTIPVIVITGSVVAPPSLSAYAVAILRKPFNLIELLSLIAEVLAAGNQRKINGTP